MSEIKHTCDIKNDCNSEQCKCEVGYDVAEYWPCVHCYGCKEKNECIRKDN